jgi:hypothetical protein
MSSSREGNVQKVLSAVINGLMILLSACQTPATAPTLTPTAAISATSTPVPTALIPTKTIPLLTHTPSDEQAQILQTIQQAVADYDQYIQTQITTGRLVVSKDAAGQESFTMKGTPEPEFIQRMDAVQQLIASQNQRYIELSQGILSVAAIPIPSPQPVTEDQIQRAVEQALTDYGHWLDDTLKSGSTVKVFDPIALKYDNMMIGDSAALAELKWQTVVSYERALKEPDQNVQRADRAVIRQFESGEVTFLQAGHLLPFYSQADEQREYRSQEWSYIIGADNRLILEITPLNALPRATGASLPQAQLEQKARDFIGMAAPGLDLSSLTFAPGQKGSNSFFRWEERTKPFLTDGFSRPFIQVALNNQGQLLNYYNTLPLAQ